MKYIIDVPDNTKQIDAMYLWHVLKSYPLSELEPYIKPDCKAIEDEVWEFVRTCLVMDGSDFVEAFDSCSYINLLKYSYQEAKAKFEAWKKQKDEIHVGDEVLHTTGDGVKGVVIKIHDDIHDDDCFDILDSDGDVYEYTSMKYWEKTGRHFDEVEELLKKIGSEE